MNVNAVSLIIRRPLNGKVPLSLLPLSLALVSFVHSSCPCHWQCCTCFSFSFTASLIHPLAIDGTFDPNLTASAIETGNVSKKERERDKDEQSERFHFHPRVILFTRPSIDRLQ